ncbi:MAG: hypothetical protein IPM16_09505 [Chloroflexi bacterium]|nr:hypothetical protein [Chloroflexota bacterium]
MRVRALRGILVAVAAFAVFSSVARADPDDGGQVDVLVLIGQNARAIAGGTDLQAIGLIDAAFDSVNQAYATAGVNTQMHVVGYQPVFFLEQINGDPNADLNSLTGTADGILDEIHALRDAYAADMVVLVAGSWFAIYDGNGHPVPPFDDDLGFIVLEMRAIATNVALKWTTRALGVDALPPFTQPQIDALNANRLTVANYRESDSRTIGASELALNGGFELDADVDGVPDFWAAKNWHTGDKWTCNAPAGSNGCVVKVKQGGAPKKLKTKIVSPPVALMDTVTGSVRALTNDGTCASVKLTVTYVDVGASKASTNECFAAADGWVTASATAQVVGTVDKIKTTILVAGQGKVWLDDASILVTPLAVLRGAR